MTEPVRPRRRRSREIVDDPCPRSIAQSVATVIWQHGRQHDEPDHTITAAICAVFAEVGGLRGNQWMDGVLAGPFRRPGGSTNVAAEVARFYDRVSPGRRPGDIADTAARTQAQLGRGGRYACRTRTFYLPHVTAAARTVAFLDAEAAAAADRAATRLNDVRMPSTAA